MGFRWREEYAVGVEEVDAQHQGMVELIERLSRAMLSGRSRKIIGGIIDELVDYAHVHFATEERLMEAAHYPGLERHREIHQSFLAKASSLQEQQRSGRLIVGMDVMRFLQDWLIKHILDEDQAFGPTLRGEVVHEPPQPEGQEEPEEPEEAS